MVEDCYTLLEKLRRGELSKRETLRTLVLFAEHGFHEAETDIAALLRSTDGDLRDYALTALVRDWRLRSYKAVAEQMLESDPENNVRIAAVFGLGTLGLAYGDRSVLCPLYQALMDEREKSGIRAEAYNFIRMIIGAPVLRRRVTEFSEITDWDMIEEVRKEMEAMDQQSPAS